MDKIKDLFLLLTSETYPHGHEKEVEKFLPHGYSKDEYGNCYIKIGKSNTIFASHMDTQSRVKSKVVHTFDGNTIKTDGKTILGADDKAGMVCMLYLIENNIPGLYYFFVGEERGCIGSSAIAKHQELFKEYNKIISFDRRGTTSVITHQSFLRTCSDEFALELATQLNKSGLSYVPDNGGICTDSLQFSDIISECTNLSVGYYREHSVDESQDIEHLSKLCEAILKVNWEELPAVRDKSVRETLNNSTFTKKKRSVFKSDTKSTDSYNYNKVQSKRNKKDRHKKYHYDENVFILNKRTILGKLTEEELNYINNL